MKKLILFSLLCLLVFTACNKKPVFEQYVKMENDSWNRFKSLRFEFQINKPDKFWDIVFVIKHLEEYPFSNLNVDMALISPNGEQRVIPFDILLKNEKGDFLSKKEGAIRNMEFVMLSKVNLKETGKYVIEIDNVMPVFETTGIRELGLLVKKTSPPKPKKDDE